MPATASASAWATRLEDPFNRYYRYPLARLIIRALLKMKVPPNRVTVVQPLLAALAGYVITFADAKDLALGAGLFELRSILACVDDTSARTSAVPKPSGHALPGMADRLSVFFLYIGIFWHFHLHPPPSGAWSQYLSVNGVLLLALLQGAVRSFAADYYRRKYTSIFERGDEPIKQMIREQASPAARIIGLLWGISSGEAFLSLVVLTLVINQLWAGQLFFASIGVAWILAVIGLNGWFTRSASRSSHPLPAPPLEIPK